MTLPRLFHEGRQITVNQAAIVCRELEGIDHADTTDIFTRAIYGEDEAVCEFNMLSGIEIIF